MKPFRSPEEMLDAHELMFGVAGRQCAEVVLKWAATLFVAPLEELNIRVVLAPVELGPYNRHTGYRTACQVRTDRTDPASHRRVCTGRRQEVR